MPPRVRRTLGSSSAPMEIPPRLWLVLSYFTVLASTVNVTKGIWNSSQRKASIAAPLIGRGMDARLGREDI